MERIYLKDLKNYYGKEVEISGFVENIRDLQWVQFVILRDSTGKVQITIEKSEEQNKAEKVTVKTYCYSLPDDKILSINNVLESSNILEAKVLTLENIQTTITKNHFNLGCL